MEGVGSAFVSFLTVGPSIFSHNSYLYSEASMGSVRAFAFLLFASLAVGALSGSVYNVIDKGAKGDGITDDAQVAFDALPGNLERLRGLPAILIAGNVDYCVWYMQAFMDTWNAACADSEAPTFLVPSRYRFSVDQLHFEGPCQSYINVQVDGTILSPNKIRVLRYNHWISFASINGITIKGKGYIDGQGAIWYDCYARQKCMYRPTAFVVKDCISVHLEGLHFKNSPMMHLSIQKSYLVTVYGITIRAPGESPNTDGIHIGRSQYVQIINSSIGTGDDCISIEAFTADVNITHVTCGPGHGISIGSLGDGDSEAVVERIRVSNCQFYGTSNGVRIKTFQGGRGHVKGVLFEHINLTSVYNPIIIDQYYGAGPNKTSAVKVSNVQYVDVVGSSATDEAIVLKCSQSTACTNINMSNVRLKSADPGKNITTICFNAYVRQRGPILPALSCQH